MWWFGDSTTRLERLMFLVNKENVINRGTKQSDNGTFYLTVIFFNRGLAGENTFTWFVARHR